jgi:hypothetical protein
MPKRRAKTYSAHPKIAENRVRGLAERWGLRLTRSRQRDGALVGTYGLYDDLADEWSFAGPWGWGKSLDECEQYLRQSVQVAAPGP